MYQGRKSQLIFKVYRRIAYVCLRVAIQLVACVCRSCRVRVYCTRVSATTTWRLFRSVSANGTINVNNELKRVWMEAVVAQSGVPCQHPSAALDKKLRIFFTSCYFVSMPLFDPETYRVQTTIFTLERFCCVVQRNYSLMAQWYLPHGSEYLSPAFHHGDLGSVPGQTKCDLWLKT